MDAFLIKKLLSNAVHIVPAAFFLLLIATVMLRWVPKLAQSVLVVVSISLIALSSAPVTNTVVSQLENQHEVLPKLPSDTALILVLGSGHHYTEDRPPNSVLMSQALARLSEGIRLWKTMPDTHIMLSGAKFLSEISHAEALMAAALPLGVEESKVVLAPNTLDTADEIEAARQWLSLNAGEDSRLVVVSSAMHLPRANLMLRGTEYNYTMAPTDFRFLDAPWYRFSAGHLRDVDAAMHEYVGMLWHRLSSK